METKLCKVCGAPSTTKPFRPSKLARDANDSYCRECGRALSRAHYVANKEQYRENAQRYRAEHPEINQKKRMEWRRRLGPGGVMRQYRERYPDNAKRIVRLSKYRRRWRKWLKAHPLGAALRSELIARLAGGEQVDKAVRHLEGPPTTEVLTEVDKSQVLIGVLQEGDK